MPSIYIHQTTTKFASDRLTHYISSKGSSFSLAMRPHNEFERIICLNRASFHFFDLFLASAYSCTKVVTLRSLQMSLTNVLSVARSAVPFAKCFKKVEHCEVAPKFFSIY
mgnify:CR=1 FL=1